MPAQIAPDPAAPPAAPTRLPVTVGVELEVSSQASRPGINTVEIARLLERANIPVFESSRRHGDHNGKWMSKMDGSCGYEVSSPVLRTMADLDQLKTVCTTLADGGAKVNNKCGLHVHIGAAGIETDGATALRLLQFFSRYEEAFFLLAGPTRINNQYARKFPDEMTSKFKTRGLEAWRDHGRYFWMNAMSYWSHGTLEFRIMPGTFDPNFVVGWTALLVTIFDSVINGEKKVSWGKAKARDNRMLLFTMLQQAGCYGKAIRNRELAVLAREWAADRFNRLNQVSAASLILPVQPAVPPPVQRPDDEF